MTWAVLHLDSWCRRKTSSSPYLVPWLDDPFWHNASDDLRPPTNIVCNYRNLRSESDFNVRGVNTRPRQKIAQNANKVDYRAFR